MTNTKTRMSLLLILSLPTLAQAQGSFGLAGAYSQSIYRGIDTANKLLPNIAYSSDRFFFKFPEVGYQLLPNNGLQSLSAGVRYDMSGFEADDSDNVDMKMLDDRDPSVMAFLAYRLGPISTKLAQDVSGEHEGYFAQISLGYPIPIGNWQLIPSVSYRYNSEKLSNHLFGVSAAESARVGGRIAAYNPPSTSVTSFGLRAIYPINDQLSVFSSVRQNQYDKDVLNSPIVSDNKATTFMAGFNYRF
ncbi:MipA/OmpV family protein [Marinomonas epiphytica]